MTEYGSISLLWNSRNRIVSLHERDPTISASNLIQLSTLLGRNDRNVHATFPDWPSSEVGRINSGKIRQREKHRIRGSHGNLTATWIFGDRRYSYVMRWTFYTQRKSFTPNDLSLLFVASTLRVSPRHCVRLPKCSFFTAHRTHKDTYEVWQDYARSVRELGRALAQKDGLISNGYIRFISQIDYKMVRKKYTAFIRDERDRSRASGSCCQLIFLSSYRRLTFNGARRIISLRARASLSRLDFTTLRRLIPHPSRARASISLNRLSRYTYG